MRLFSAAALALVIPCCASGQILVASLGITKTHTGIFNQGQAGATYTVTVSNALTLSDGSSAHPTIGTVTVTEAAPPGLTLVSMAGAGWSCPDGGTTCTRADALAPGASYPAITVTVNVAANATSPQVNAVSVACVNSASANAADSTMLFPTVTVPGQNYTIQTFAGGGVPQNVPATSASLQSPNSIAVDSAGNQYFAGQNNVVLRVDAATGALTLVAGNGTSGFSGDNGPAASAQLNSPQGVAFDTAGNLYIADAGNNRIRKVSNGVITTVAGNGTAGFSGDSGPATGAKLNGPTGVAVDAAGILYIADTGNYRVRKVSNGVITTVAGNGTGGGSTGDGGPATSGGLGGCFPYLVPCPLSVAVDSSGNLYIADSGNNAVRKVSNGVITTVAGNYWAGGYFGDNGPATSAQLNFPTGVATDAAGNLYIADSYNNRIRKISGGVITTVAGNGPTTTPPYFELQEGVQPPNGLITAAARRRLLDAIGDSGPATSGQLNLPSGVAMDSAGNLFIADSGNNRIRKVANGLITTVAGSGSSCTNIDVIWLGCYIGDNGPATSAQLDFPQSVAVDTVGNVYIADTANDRVRMVSNGAIATVAGNGTAGNGGDNGPAANAQLNVPRGVAVDAAGNLYVADTGNNSIREVLNGVTSTVGTQLSSPSGVAVDAAGNVYIADTNKNRIRKISNGAVTTVAGNGIIGFAGDTGPAANAQLNQPFGVAVDAAGNLYIADAGNHRVREVTNGVITTVAGNGTATYGGDNGPAASAQLNNPAGVAVDAAGNLYIADTSNARIRKVSNGVIITVAGGGSSLGDNGPATSAQLSNPTGVAVDAAGNVYVADEANNRIRVLVPAGGSCSASVAPLVLSPSAAGGNLTVTIQTDSSCAWAIQNLPGWITVSGNPVGTGPGSATLTVAANPAGARAATISVAGIWVQVNQSPEPCIYALTSTSQAVPATGGAGSFGVTCPNWCSWTASSPVSWITVTGGASGTANGTVSYQVAANTGAARSAALTVAGQSFALQQAGAAPIVLSIVTPSPLPQGTVGSAYSQTLGASGGAPPYAWSVTSGSLPIGLSLAGATGALSGTPTTPGVYSFAAQVTDSASATASATFAVTIQPPGCTYSIYPAGQAFSIAGGSGNITVTAPAGCVWNSSGLPSWVNVTSGASGSGNGALTYQIAANTGAWRSAAFTVAGASFVVEQSSATVGSLTTIGAIPHMSIAGGWQTSIMLVNLGTSSAQARLNFFDDNGAAMLDPLSFPQAPLSGTFLAAQLERTIAPNAAVVIQTCGTGVNAFASWAQLQSNGSITAFARFTWNTGQGPQEAVVPLESRTPNSFVLWYDQSDGFVTGMAVANMAAASASVAVTVRDDTGTVLASSTLPTLNPYGHTSFLLTDPAYYPVTAGKRGTVEFKVPSGGQIATLAFRAALGTLSTVPAMVK